MRSHSSACYRGTRHAKKAFQDGLPNVKNRLDSSIETEKEKTEALVGAPAVVEGLRSGKIACRVFRKDKFHAKAYIMYACKEVIESSALVGSSRFFYATSTFE